jgi:hypothetical protein
LTTVAVNIDEIASTQMRLKHHRMIGFSWLVILVLGGCDTGRVGMYKVSFAPSAVGGASVSEQASADEKLKQLVRCALAGKGFEEHPGTPHIWRKRGATVEVYRDKNGELILRVGAFGSKRDVRVSERTERELLELLKEQSGLELTPTTPPNATID